MDTKTINISEEHPQLNDLLSLAREGHEVLLTEGNAPLARLVPVRSDEMRIGGLHDGEIWTSDDFDEPLTDDFWLGKE